MIRRAAARLPSLAQLRVLIGPQPGHPWPGVRKRSGRCPQSAPPHPRVFYAMAVTQLANELAGALAEAQSESKAAQAAQVDAR